MSLCDHHRKRICQTLPHGSLLKIGQISMSFGDLEELKPPIHLVCLRKERSEEKFRSNELSLNFHHNKVLCADRSQLGDDRSNAPVRKLFE